MKRALKELAEAEAAATVALAAAAGAEKAAGFVLAPTTLGPALDVHVASAAGSLATAAQRIEEASAAVKTLITTAMGGKPVSKPALPEAMETLQSAIVEVSSYRAVADSAAARL